MPFSEQTDRYSSSGRCEDVDFQKLNSIYALQAIFQQYLFSRIEPLKSDSLMPIINQLFYTNASIVYQQVPSGCARVRTLILTR